MPGFFVSFDQNSILTFSFLLVLSTLKLYFIILSISLLVDTGLQLAHLCVFYLLLEQRHSFDNSGYKLEVDRI